MADYVDELRRRAGLNEAMSNDQITHTMFQHVSTVRDLAQLAYGCAQSDGISVGHRRTFERIGMRATDLLNELAAFVKQQS